MRSIWISKSLCRYGKYFGRLWPCSYDWNPSAEKFECREDSRNFRKYPMLYCILLWTLFVVELPSFFIIGDFKRFLWEEQDELVSFISLLFMVFYFSMGLIGDLTCILHGNDAITGLNKAEELLENLKNSKGIHPTT